jgi:hypothetical protein
MNNIKEIADRLGGTSAEALLTEKPLMNGARVSYCQGSDTLVELGLWDMDGQWSDLARDVRDELLERRRAAELAL